jgi:hypothetical protein
VPAIHRCDPERHCTFIVWHEDVTAEEWHAHADAVLADPLFPPGKRILTDMRTSGGAPSITDTVVREIGARLNAESAVFEKLQLAIVPNGAWTRAQLLLDEEVSIPGLRAMTFTGLGTACVWLGLDYDDVQPVLQSLREELKRST